jgi:hypothetical protein
MSGASGIATVVEAAALAALAARGVAEEEARRLAKQIGSRCAGIPHLQLSPVRPAPMTAITRRAREKWVEAEIHKFNAELVEHLDAVIGYLVMQMVEMAVEQRGQNVRSL